MTTAEDTTNEAALSACLASMVKTCKSLLKAMSVADPPGSVDWLGLQFHGKNAVERAETLLERMKP